MKDCNVQEERMKTSNMVWMLVQITDISSLLSEAHVWECTGSDKIKNYWLEAFPADQRHITKITLMC